MPESKNLVPSPCSHGIGWGFCCDSQLNIVVQWPCQLGYTTQLYAIRSIWQGGGGYLWYLQQVLTGESHYTAKVLKQSPAFYGRHLCLLKYRCWCSTGPRNRVPDHSQTDVHAAKTAFDDLALSDPPTHEARWIHQQSTIKGNGTKGSDLSMATGNLWASRASDLNIMSSLLHQCLFFSLYL